MGLPRLVSLLFVASPLLACNTILGNEDDYYLVTNAEGGVAATGVGGSETAVGSGGSGNTTLTSTDNADDPGSSGGSNSALTTGENSGSGGNGTGGVSGSSMDGSDTGGAGPEGSGGSNKESTGGQGSGGGAVSSTGGGGSGGSAGGTGGTVGSDGTGGVSSDGSAGGTGGTGETGGSGSGGGGTGGTTNCRESVVFVAPSGSGLETGCGASDAAPSIQTALAAVEDGGVVKIAGGTYADQEIAITRSVSLQGGYDASFSSRDPATHVTTLSGSGSAVVTLTGEAVDSETIVDGFHIEQTGTGDAVVVESGAAPTFLGNTIVGGNGGDYSRGVHVRDGGSPTVRNNYVRGRNSTWQSTGIQVDSSAGPVLIENNRIETGYSDYTHGLDLNADGTIVRNNVVFGGAGTSQSRGIAVFADVTIANNTIHGGTGGASTGIYNSGGFPVVINNILFGPGGSFGSCISSTQQTPPSFMNNLLFACGAAFYEHQNSNLTTIGAVNALNNEEVFDGTCTPSVDCETAQISGNVSLSLDPSAVFVDIDGGDDALGTLLDNDWHLLITDTAITEGGHDSSLSDCGTAQTPTSCGDVDVDFDDALRTVPYSIGAFEE